MSSTSKGYFNLPCQNVSSLKTYILFCLIHSVYLAPLKLPGICNTINKFLFNLTHHFLAPPPDP